MKLAALLLLSVPLFAEDIVSLYGHIPGAAFRLPIPDSELNWRETAIRIVGKEVEKPDSRLQDLWANKDSAGNTDFNFQVPVPQAMKDRKYYAISQYGLTPLRAKGLVGGIRYNFDPFGTKPEIKKIAFGGNALFDTIPEDEYVEAAFALITDAAVISDAADVPEGALVVAPEGITYTLDGVKRSLLPKAPFTSMIEGAGLVTIAADRYLFIQWAQERGSCAYNFSLLKLTATGLDETASTIYGCEQ